MFDFTVTPDDGEPFEVTADSRDVLVWEKTTRGASIMSLLREYKMTDLYKLSHIAARREGLFPDSLAEFEKCKLDFRESPAPDPTRPAP